jgi:hypothetical protein
MLKYDTYQNKINNRGFIMETLSLTQIANMAEILGVILIVVSVIYVAIQINQNTLAIRSDTAQAVHNGWGEVYGRISSNSELAGILVKGSPSIDKLNDVEKTLFIAFWMQTLLTWQNAYYQSKTGSLDKDHWQTMEKTSIQIYLTSPGYREFWAIRKVLLPEDFVQYLEQKFTTTEVTPEFKPFGSIDPITEDK